MLDILKKILNETAGLDKDISLEMDTVISRDLKINSLEMVSLVCAVEDEFDIEIDDKDIKSIVTIGDLITYIENQQ